MNNRLDLPGEVLAEIVRAADREPLMVWMTSADGAAQYVNPEWTRYTGLSEEASLGLGWRAALHPGDVEKGIDRWLQCVKLKVANEDPLRYRNVNGQYHLKFSHTFPLENTQGNVMHWLGAAVESASEHYTVLTFFTKVIGILESAGQTHAGARLRAQLDASVLVTGTAKNVG